VVNPPHLALFDIDGTLCDSQAAEDACFVQAVHKVMGIVIDDTDWSRFQTTTTRGILTELSAENTSAPTRIAETEAHFVALLREAQPTHPGDFQEIPGAQAFLAQLEADPAWQVGIATGGVAEEARFKLACCGLDLDAYPHATSSDALSREAIMQLATARAGCPLSRTIYFGDNSWDVRATERLGIPLIGIGHKTAKLQALGVRHTFRDYRDPDSILAAMG